MPDPDLINLLSADAASNLARALVLTPRSGAAPSDLAPHPDRPHAPAIPGYTLAARLGSGGEGDVYRAYRQGSASPVALKILHPRATPQAQQRAWRELAALQALRSPHVPRLVDFGVAPVAGVDRVYFATELVEGVPIDEALAHAPLPRKVELLAQACDAVQSIHERPLLHRDLKPDNILLDASAPKPHVMIIDFGLADLLAVEQATLTLEGTPLGTPAYMAPEQAKGEVHAWSVRTDVFGLGATAYRLLTGQAPRPPGASIHGALLAAATEPVPAACSVQRDLPEALSLIVAKAMAPRPGDRYASAADLARDLRAFLAGEPVSVVRPSRWRRAIAWAGRHPAWVSAGASVGVLFAGVVTSLLAVWWMNYRPYRVVLERGEIESRVYSRAGAIVKSWQTDAAFALACEAQGPNGERLAVIADRDRAGPHDWSGRLAVYDFSDLDTPRWTTPILERDLNPPPHLRSPPDRASQSRFVLGSALVADLFPDLPGDEIVAVINHTLSSASVVRVYDTAGTVLDEFWHDGRIYGVQWLANARRLVFCASNNEIYWNRLGVIDPPDHPWSLHRWNLGSSVYVVFAVEPQPRKSTIASADGLREGSTVALWPNHRSRQAAFYRLLQPLVLSNIDVKILFQPSHFGSKGVERVRLDAAFTRAGGTVSIDMDAQGRILSITGDDTFRAKKIDPAAPRPALEQFGAVEQPGQDSAPRRVPRG